MSSNIQELSNRADLWALGVHLAELKKSLKLFSSVQVDNLTQKLANRMQTGIPKSSLDRLKIMPIPRGGHFVAGHLAYRLNFKHEQYFDDGKSPVCIIDDCALTGKRFRQVLHRLAGRDVWFCHLVSAPELRDAIIRNEPNVQGCIAAGDLAIRQNKLAEQMTAEDRYLNVSVDHVAFPWTEPGIPVTNPFSNEVEDGWRLLPPHLVLGNWSLLQIPPQPVTKKPEIQSSSQVVWRLSAAGILLYEESSQCLFEISGLAAGIWKGCAGYQHCDAAINWMLTQYPAASVQELKAIIDKLVAKKLLVQL